MQAPQTHWRWIALAALLTMLQAQAGMQVNSVRYQVYRVNQIRVNVISVDLHDRSLLVTPALAYNRPGKRQSFISFLNAHQPLAQITGSYFSMRSALPIGDIVIDGQLRHMGPVGSALAIRHDNSAVIVNIPYNWYYSWPGFESVVKGGIRLVQEGRFAVFPRDQGFRDPDVFRAATRTAVGLRNAHNLVMVAVSRPIYLSQLAYIMLSLDCHDAMTLDGGTSMGMAFGSNIIHMPGRSLSNVLIVVRRPSPVAATPSAPVIAAQPEKQHFKSTEIPMPPAHDTLAPPLVAQGVMAVDNGYPVIDRRDAHGWVMLAALRADAISSDLKSFLATRLVNHRRIRYSTGWEVPGPVRRAQWPPNASPLPLMPVTVDSWLRDPRKRARVASSTRWRFSLPPRVLWTAHWRSTRLTG